MPSYSFTTDSTVAGIAANLTSAEDGVFVAAGATVTSTASSAIVGIQASHTALISGRVVGAENGILLGDALATDNAHWVNIRSGAEVIGFSGAGVWIQGFNSVVVNHGAVFGRPTGVHMEGSGGAYTSSLTNTGTIESTGYGVVRSGSESFSLTNSGTISGGDYAFATGSGGTAFTTISITNTGTMNGVILLGMGDDTYDGRSGRAGYIDGAAGNDRIYGGAESNSINGAAGADYLAGGGGNDTYSINLGLDAVPDTVVEGANAGIDTVTFSPGAVGQGYILGANVERLTILGGAAANGTGNSLANVIVGSSFANVINGGLGLDVLTGGADNDSFVFNTGLSAANRDRITDLNVAGNDTIRLENAIFTGLGPANNHFLTAGQFNINNANGVALQTDDRIIYDRDNGQLWYDSNGSLAGGVRVNFATVIPNQILTWADFYVI